MANITKETVIARAIAMRDRLGRIPSHAEAKAEICGYSTIQRLFGNWTILAKEAFGVDIVVHPPRPTISCKHCGNPTKNPRYCSISCAATHNNTSRPRKPLRTYHCQECSKDFPGRRKTCPDCTKPAGLTMDITIGKWRANSKHNAHSQIRDYARKAFFKAGNKKECQNCGYSLHIDVCHIVGIGTYPDDTPVLVINDPANLIGLCVRCHWEYDHGHLTLDQIRNKK